MQHPQIIDLPKIKDSRGNLTFIESSIHIPFNIKRIYWIYDVPGGCYRGGHAFLKQHEIIIALSGSFDIIVDDGKQKKTYSLNRSYLGLYIPSMYWREINNFSTNSLALILSSTLFSENDYIRNFEDFLKIKKYERN